jgi:hypothetical protein
MAIEPYGSKDADLISACGREIGEIKHAGELVRDLRGYWSQWNSSQSFGGKTPAYKLGMEFSDEVAQLNSRARGWLAVVFGQLRHYCCKHGAQSGWLVFEDVATHGSSLNEALSFLTSEGKANVAESAAHNNVGFVQVRFLQM